MWEQIRSNKRKSTALVIAMAFILLALGFSIGAAIGARVVREAPQEAILAAGLLGATVALIVWFVMAVSAYFAGGRMLLAVSGARRIEKSDHPRLFNVVEEMTIASGLKKMPDVYIIDDMAMNAFATGRDPEHSAVAVTAGLLGRLNRDQLQGVIAHEVGHIVNRDVLFMQMLAIMLGAIVMLAEIMLRGMFYSSVGHRRRSRNSSGSGGGQLQIILIVVAVVLAILAPVLARMIYFAASRRREYLADAQAAVFTRYPEGLASALEAIAGDTRELASANRAMAPMYISNPLKKKLSAVGAFSTHPPADERVKILRGMGGGVSYAAYASASEELGLAPGSPASALTGGETAAVRAAHPDAGKPATRSDSRGVGDALRGAGKFVFLPCACGLQVKLPPNFKKKRITCPRCGARLTLPAAVPAGAGGPEGSAQGLEVERRAKGWMSFSCSCGELINLSPAFAADHTTCKKCKRRISVKDRANKP